MRTLLILVFLFSASFIYAQDPTVPSAALLERLNVSSDVSRLVETRPIPVFKLRSMVMRDPNHGSAIIEAGKHRYRISLNRSLLKSADQEERSDDWRNQVQIDGRQYRLQDFRPGVLVLHDGHRQILVQ